MTTTQRTPDQIELLQRTLEQIEAHPDEWDQSVWRCDTGMCFAGWAVTLAGRQWAYPKDSGDAALVIAEPDDTDTVASLYEDEPETATAESVAMRLLGLTKEEADMLFWGGNSIEVLGGHVANLVAGRDIDDDEGFPNDSV